MNSSTKKQTKQIQLPTINGNPINSNGIAQTGRPTEAPSLAEIHAAYELFERFEGCEPCQWVSSYRLKHFVEHSLGYRYISNGSCQIAAALAGYPQRVDRRNGVNSKIFAPVEMLRSIGIKTSLRPKERLPVVVIQPDGSTFVKPSLDSSAPQLQPQQPQPQSAEV